MSDRHEMQAAGTHPAPCARHCESTAYEIELRRLRAELAASREREVRMQWQPIETAPKDGNWVLLGYFPSYMEGVQQGGMPEIAYWSSGAWANNCGKALATAGPFSPTHWMPLPAPPIAALAEGAQG